MKKIKAIAITLALMTLIISGCYNDQRVVTVYEDEYPPAPTGLTSITGDELITLLWYPVDVDDIDVYEIWYAPGNADPEDPDDYIRLDVISAYYTSWDDYDVQNGVTYYYAVTAVDEGGKRSYFSDYVMDTPRDEGLNVRIYDYHIDQGSSGYDLYYQDILAYDDSNCDFYLEYDSFYGEFFINITYDDYYIQDFGYADGFDDIGYAPSTGWSAFSSVEAVEGHIYMLKLRHFDEWHYAKIWITDLNYSSRSMVFSWAYQIDPGNRELKIVPQVLKPKLEMTTVN